MRRWATRFRSSHAVFQLPEVDHVVALGDAHHLGEVAHRGGRVALAAQGADRRHAGIVPAHHGALLHELQKTALGHHRIGEVQAGEFVLVRGIDVERLDEPVVERTVHVEFEGADRVGDPFDRIALAMRIVVHRIDAPFVTRAVMLGVQDAVHDRVAEQHVRVRHVDFGSQHQIGRAHV